MKDVPLESYTENRKTKPWFDSIGCWYLKLFPFRVGIPDRAVIGPGRLIFFIETKREGKTPRKIQAHIHKLLRGFGFHVYVCTSLGEAKAAFTKETGIETSGRADWEIHTEVLSRGFDKLDN